MIKGVFLTSISIKSPNKDKAFSRHNCQQVWIKTMWEPRIHLNLQIYMKTILSRILTYIFYTCFFLHKYWATEKNFIYFFVFKD